MKIAVMEFSHPASTPHGADKTLTYSMAQTISDMRHRWVPRKRTLTALILIAQIAKQIKNQ